ncbi:hypothetical protein MASR1M32_31230 [Rhodobacter sp.]
MAADLLALGCHEIALGETLGRGTSDQVDAMLAAVVAVVPPARLAGHFHDTSGRALDNIATALRHGLRVFDAAAGGLGGCPSPPVPPAMSRPSGSRPLPARWAFGPASTPPPLRLRRLLRKA